MGDSVASFLIVRHGESAANAGAYFASQTDSLLTERGHRQAETLASAFRDVHLDAIYCSDLLRCRDTIAPLSRGRDVAVQFTPLLRERHMGEFTGMTFDDARARFPEIWMRMIQRDPDVSPPGGESLRAHAERMAGFLDGLPERHAGHRVLLGTHGVTIQHLIRHLLGVSDFGVPLWLNVDNASVTRIDVATDRVVHRGRIIYANRIANDDDRHWLP